VPVPHFGLALTVDQFHSLSERMKAASVRPCQEQAMPLADTLTAFKYCCTVQVSFELEPHVRFEGQPGEQWTMFVKDPSGNCLEFKAMTNPKNLFAKYVVDS
jgi:uncharacterized protein